MDNIKQINTEIAELLAVKVPDTYDHRTVDDALMVGTYRNNEGWIEKFYADLPEGNWTPLDLSDQLTEEQCAELIEPEVRILSWPENTDMPEIEEVTAKEAFASLMAENECYSENPYGTQPHNIGLLDLYPFGHPTMDYQLESARKWQQAEANTGTWLILKRI